MCLELILSAGLMRSLIQAKLSFEAADKSRMAAYAREASVPTSACQLLSWARLAGAGRCDMTMSQISTVVSAPAEANTLLSGEKARARIGGSCGLANSCRTLRVANSHRRILFSPTARIRPLGDQAI